MALSTPGSRLPKWRSTLQSAYILKVQEFPILNAEDMQHTVRQLRLRKIIKAPIEGVMQIYFDEMNFIAKHLEAIAAERNVEVTTNDATVRLGHEPVLGEHVSPLPPGEPPPPAPNITDVAQAFTKTQIMHRNDWTEWESNQFKQWNQIVLSNPLPLSKNSNVLQML